MNVDPMMQFIGNRVADAGDAGSHASRSLCLAARDFSVSF